MPSIRVLGLKGGPVEKRSMTTWVIVALFVVGITGYLVARSRQAPPGGAAAPEVAKSASTAPPLVSKPGGGDLLGGLKALLFADQNLKDELASMAQFDLHLQEILASVDKGDCADATRRATALDDGSSPQPHVVLLLVAYVKSVCGDRPGAVEALQQFRASVHGASHPTLQTWYRLRQLGVEPPPENVRDVLGLIVEIGFPDGTDIVAAYADGSSRSFGRHGDAVLGKEQRVDVQDAARRVLAAAVPFVKSARKESTRGGLGSGVVRFTFLTPGGPLVSEAVKDELKSGKSELLPLFTPVAELQSLKVQGQRQQGR